MLEHKQVYRLDRNANVNQKVTYEYIWQHHHVYKRKFTHGTVMQLCVAHNKRRRSATRYHSVVRVTTCKP